MIKVNAVKMKTHGDHRNNKWFKNGFIRTGQEEHAISKKNTERKEYLIKLLNEGGIKLRYGFNSGL